MPDIAVLGIAVDATQVRAAGTALDKLGAQGEAAGVRAANGLGRIKAAIRDNLAAAKAGAISGAEYVRTSLALNKQADDLRRVLAQIPPAADKVNEASARSVQGLGRFRNAINNLGLGLAGVTGPMQKVVETIAILGVGSTTVTAVLGGVAALALVFTKLTEQTRKAQKAYDDYIASLHKTGPLDAIGGQLDEVQSKLASLTDGFKGTTTGFSGGFNRFVRGLFASGDKKSVLGMLFGVQSEEELRQQAKGLGQQYGEAFRFGQNDAFAKGRAVAEEERKKDLAAIEARKKAEIEYWNIRNNGLTTFRGNLLPEWQGTTGTGPAVVPGIPAILQGHGNAGSGFTPAANDSKKIAESWQSASQSVANVVTLLANADDLTARMLGNMVSLVGQIEDAVKAGKLTVTSTVGLIAGGISLLAGAFGKSEAELRFEKIQKDNTDAINRLRGSLNTLNLGITGNQFTTARAGIGGVLAGQAASLASGRLGINFNDIRGILSGSGTSITALKDLAKDLGLALDTSSETRFIESLKKLNQALDEIALVTLKDFGGQLDLINRRAALAGDGPMEKIASLLGLITGSQGAPGLATLGNFDLSGAGGRNAALTYLQNQLLKAQNGGLTTAELGGLTVQQYLDFISQFGDLLNQANQQLQQTVDNLKNFADSLKLDQGLTTLSPVQQLEEARRQYETVRGLAFGGDQNAAARLPELARQFLQASRGYNASGTAYASDFARVLADTEALQKLFQGQEDGWKALEKPMVNVQDNTASTVDRLETLIEVQRVGLQETVDKLDAIRSEMAASVLAQKVAFEGQAK